MAKVCMIGRPPTLLAPTETPTRRRAVPAAARLLARQKPRQSFDGDPTYDARATVDDPAFCFSAAISVFAAGPDELGFCPVISKPSVTTCTAQSAFFGKVRPNFSISFST